MTVRHAACSCEQLRLTAEGDPVAISVCPHPGVALPQGIEHDAY